MSIVKKKIALIWILIATSFSAQADILKDFDSLGGNDVLVERAQLLQPEKSVSVVQNRVVDRRIRHEFSVGYSNYLGGDAYLETQSVDLAYNFHINPYVSVGLGYFSNSSEFSKEGRYTIDVDGLIPDVEAIDSGYEIAVYGYPMYGKINLLNMGVVHFDFYGVASYGKMTLATSESNHYSVGGGIGLWISQHITSRIELRQRYFTAQKRISGATSMDQTVLSVSIGYLL